jgi:phosphinothricin acetyltransferase
MTIKFRVAAPADAAGILAIYAPYCEVSPISFEDVSPTVEQMSERIRGVLTQYPWLVCEISGQLAGYVYANKIRERAAYRWAVETAVYVDTAHHRRGLAKALYMSLFSILREQGYFKTYAGITLPNPASVRLHESVGFRSVGVFGGIGYKLGKWHDVGWWQLDLQPEIENPPEPRPFNAVRQTSALQAALLEGERLMPRLRRGAGNGL